MVYGEDRIAGQLWEIETEHLQETLQVLDKIEGTDQPGEVNEYDRCKLDTWLWSGEQAKAWGYVFSQPDLLKRFAVVGASLFHRGKPLVVWPVGCHWKAQDLC